MSGGLDIYGQWKFGRSDTKERTGVHLAGTEIKKKSCRNDSVRDGMFSFLIYIGNFVRSRRTKRRFLDLVFQYFCVGTNRKCTVADFFLTGRNTEKLCLFKRIWKHLKTESMNFKEQKMVWNLEYAHRLLNSWNDWEELFCVIKEQLIEEKEETNELVTDISHQIKTPISAIHMSLELLQDTQTTEAEKQEFFGSGAKGSKKVK